MPSRRIERINEQLRTELADLIAREMQDPRLAGLVSLTAVETSPDIRHARVYVSVLGSDDDLDGSLRALRSGARFLRRMLSERLALRVVPELQFVADRSIERGDRVMRIFREIERESGPGAVGPPAAES